MPNSLRSMIKKLHHKGKITEREKNDLLAKLDGHDREVRNKTIDDCVTFIKENSSHHYLDCDSHCGVDTEEVFRCEWWLDDMVEELNGYLESEVKCD